MENAHDIASDLYETGMIDVQTMRKFDVMCFPEVKELSSTQIKKIRLREKVSQPVFARCLNISAATVKKWEQGENQPNGISLMILNLIAERGLGYLSSAYPVAV
ncbi:MAG: transcriptional regulator [Gammaproteobacteria bacterium]|nr:transcriptional regulator [Gammaproteobacteria bacterium]